ncbi:hypothetical protein [Patulibacter americanus]|uniref:hypothetical protein n=1 Tax=Patulibacter americanus TaxID=588672 RepID=UPI0003B70E6E|nr:hypothetical protein [Patulibacter americanus]
MTEIHWQFRPENPDGGRDFGNANVWAFDPTLEVFTREVCQNVLDVRKGDHVDVDFALYRLTGNALRAFEDEIGWPELQPHLDASADETQKFGRELRVGLDRLADEDELIVLSIQELDSRGLVGAERGTNSNFAALCRNNLDSNKASTAGGAFGLGKAVLWRCSSLSTVLFHSDLAEAEPENPEHRLGRFFGRCELAWHETTGGRFAGPGWFGARDSEDQAVSAWDMGSRAADMLLDRPTGTTGTSILVLGFQDPSNDGPDDVASMAHVLARALAVHFWPAIGRDLLRPTVGYYDAGPLGPRTEVDLPLGQEVGPYVALLEARRAGALDESLVEVGGVVARRAELTVPDRQDQAHAETVHRAELLVRRADPETEQAAANSVALVRGLGMVVEYWRLPNLRIGARPFHAVLLCGAATDDEAADVAEQFLRSAEPPSHDMWTLTPDMKASYRRGGGASLEQLRGSVRSTLRDLVAPTSSDGEDGPEALSRMLAIKAPTRPSGEPRVTKAEGGVDDGVWKIEASVVASVRAGQCWTFRPVVRVVGESGAVDVEMSSLEAVKNCDVTGETVTVSSGKKKCRFRVEIDSLSLPGRPEDVAIDVALRDTQEVAE